MRSKSVVALTSVIATFIAMVSAAVFALLMQTGQSTADAASQLNASLLAGADLDEAASTAGATASYDLSSHQTLSRVILLIRENYVEPERINPYEMFIAALDYIQKTVPEVIVDDKGAPQRVVVHVGKASQTFELGGLDQLWEVTMALRDIFRFLQSHIDDAELRRDIEYAAINGMLSTLDPHSVLLKPESFDEVKLSTKGEFGGLGIVISVREGMLSVISPIEGTPAARAGIKTHDSIVKIGEESTVNMSLEEAVHLLRGKPGSKVNIWVMRKKWPEPKRFQLTRAVIKIKSVTSQLLDDGVGYLRIKSFQNNTFDDLNAHLQKLRNDNQGQQLRGLVLDLRNNPGGLLDQAILVSDRFIENGPLVITVGEGNRKRDVKMAHASGTEAGYPIAVLVNGGSASASEIVSGALKNHNRAIVIGDSTFGKGSVQVLYDFKDRSALKLTIAQYLTPGDVSIQSVGIDPDVQVVPATIAKERVHLFAQDVGQREKDLDKHLGQHKSPEAVPIDALPITKVVHVLSQSEQDEADGTASKDEEVDEEQGAPDEFKYDFETRLAKDILTHTKSLDRRSMIEQSKALFEQRSVDQEKDITERFTAIGIDWSKGAESPSLADVRVELAVPEKAIMAGSSFVVKAVVRNQTQQTLHRVYGVTTSDNPLLNNLEFAFGKMQPNEVKEWSVNVKLPKDMSARADQIKLTVSDGPDTQKGIKTAAFVRVDEIPKPRFAYTYRLNESTAGNGDGVLQVGEKAKLTVDVRNLGPGVAEDAAVTLKNMAGKSLFLEQGRAKLGDLKVGEAKTAELIFTVKAPLEENAKGAELRMTIWDAKLGASLTESMSLPLAEARAAKPLAQSLKVVGSADVEVPIYAGANDSMPLVAMVKPGFIIKSDATFGDWTRVVFAKGATGFMHSMSLQPAKAPKVALTKGLRIIDGKQAPLLSLDLTKLVTQDETIQLSGRITDDDRLKDVFIFVNDKKVYYRDLATLPKRDGQVTAPLDVRLPLKAGANGIAVVVRESNDVVTRKTFGIFRDATPAVAATLK